jgi:hypothetical protein
MLATCPTLKPITQNSAANREMIPSKPIFALCCLP